MRGGMIDLPNYQTTKLINFKRQISKMNLLLGKIYYVKIILESMNMKHVLL